MNFISAKLSASSAHECTFLTNVHAVFNGPGLNATCVYLFVGVFEARWHGFLVTLCKPNARPLLTLDARLILNVAPCMCKHVNSLTPSGSLLRCCALLFPLLASVLIYDGRHFIHCTPYFITLLLQRWQEKFQISQKPRTHNQHQTKLLYLIEATAATFLYQL